MRRNERRNEKREVMRSMLPEERKEKGGRQEKDNGQMVNEMLYWLNTGIGWRDLPERFGPWKTVYTRHRRWREQGVWKQVFRALIEQNLVDETTLMLDSTTVKVHQHGAGRKKGALAKDEATEG